MIYQSNNTICCVAYSLSDCVSCTCTKVNKLFSSMAENFA